MTSGARIETFGCRLNSWESEVIREHTKQSGCDNMVVINTYAVTAEAEKQARHTHKGAGVCISLAPRQRPPCCCGHLLLHRACRRNSCCSCWR